MTDIQLRRLCVNAAKDYVGLVKGDERHKALIDYYNANCLDKEGKLPRGYKITYSDSYCASAVSAWWNMAGLDCDLAPYECGVGEMIYLAKTKGIWVENDNYVPQIGDGITFSWNGKEGEDNTGWGKHVALVVGVDEEVIQTINPNTNGGRVEYTDFEIGHKDIRGFICPKYSILVKEEKPERIIVPKKRYLYIDRNGSKCNIQQGSVIRNYLLDSDRFEIIGEDDEYYQIKVEDWATWYPLVKKSDCE